ncbi:Gfo/Idh/MocA family protein [Planctomicrobium piriforme]|uniref:Tat (Twin-arginine translocation) pathway signal sequence n=1 Tax=Planctomicrobium piriforme TaxID=1576369 RepID=A0A1I3CF26_9PLAN|nr:Gfo/Idh/MocA family oxidoreductase [Planctomicrobium piriforme]SFH73164.1 Tat (twin-arginine translocation) pathway signal sequence [Planctomicrobium piriforme]
MPHPNDLVLPTRRDFLKTGAMAGLAGGLLAGFPSAQAFAAGNDILKVGLIGCGGRGTGAANQALMADPKTQLIAVGDAFADAIEPSLNALKSQKDIAERVVVDKDHQFVGLDAYRHVIDACDVVVLASPPGFRPEHLAYAVEHGKHIFCEKPVATDIAGIKSAMESVRRAKEKNLALVAGFCWRYDYAKRAFFERVLNGAIGKPLCTYATYLTGPVKPMQDESARTKEMTDLEWQMRNWYNFTWLSGDGLVEQAVHAVDWIAWSKGDVMPVSCTAVGGRQIPPKGRSNLFDHIEVNYLWGDGTRGFIAQRQMPGCYGENNCYVLATEGQGDVTRRGVTTTGKEKWKYDGPTPNMYQVEHDELFKSIRDGKPINDGDRLVSSTALAIMGRMAGYTGKEITWEGMMNSDERMVPETPNWDAPVKWDPVPLPGISKTE